MSVMKSKDLKDQYFFSEFANTEQLGRQIIRKSTPFSFSSWFDFSSSQIRTWDGWVQSENATAVLCRPPLKDQDDKVSNTSNPLIGAPEYYTRNNQLL